MSQILRRLQIWLDSHTRNQIVFAISVLAVLASIGWGIFEGGWEPWIVALIGIAGVLSNFDFYVYARKGHRLSPEERLAARDKWRPQFEDYFLETARSNYQGDAIIHDVSRLDEYPNDVKETGGISPWFRVGLMGTSNDGVLLGLRWTHLIEVDGNLVEAKYDDDGEKLKVMLLGEVPYESIQSVNFDGDKYYNKPHIFCHFEYKGEPFRQLFYGEEYRLFDDSPWHYREIAEYQRRSPKKR